MGRKSDNGDVGSFGLAEARLLSRRDFLAGAGAGLFVLGFGGMSPAAEAQAAPPALDIFGGYPRAFFYRHVEGEIRDGGLSYEEWEKRYLPLGGIVGKVLNEAHDYSSTNNRLWFLRYKNQNPSKMVLLHYNGTGRRATDETNTKFFAGHWLYYRGTKLTSGISNSQTDVVLHVEDTSVFDTRRYGIAEPDDIVITRVNATTDVVSPRWDTAEQVRLVSIDRVAKTITVRRGQYGTRLGVFPRGSYLAAHVTTGPYRYNDTPEQSVPLWNYNFSTACPRDESGNNCGDALADYLGEKLGPSGDLASLDGIVFDVFSWVIRFGYPIQEIDVNVDGKADRGVIRGVNVVSKGALAFLQKLRAQLRDKILLADGHIPRESQRGFGYLNGIESEGYPDKYDIHLDHLSRGENIFGFWKQNSEDPQFNYLNFRYKQRKPERYRNTFTEPTLSRDKSYQKMRLALASALFADSAFTYSGGDLLNGGDGWLPPEVVWREAPGGPARVRVFDELWKGTEQTLNWLGLPLGPPVRLAARAPDYWGEQGRTWPGTFVGRFEGEGVVFSREGTEAVPMLEVTASGPDVGALSFTSPAINVTGGDLFISLRLRADPLEGFPATVPRRVDVHAVPASGELDPLNREFTWADGQFFNATLYYQDVGPGTVRLKFVVEGNRRLLLQTLTAHVASNGNYREFENGVVFANPSTASYRFDVASLLPGRSLRRIRGTSEQDPVTNSGAVVGEQLTLPPKSGLFLVKV